MKIVLSHPTGNANVRAVANAFVQEQLLAKFYTSIACFPGNLLDKISIYKLFSEVKRRNFDIRLEPYTKMYPWFETGRLIAPKLGLKNLVMHEIGFLSIDNVYRKLDKSVANKLKTDKPNALYAYEDGAYYSFKAAQELGIACLYDLPIGYWRSARKLLENEREIWPDWADTLIGFADSDEKLASKDEELKMATQIFVASKFTASTLKDYPGKLADIHVIPYGFPQVSVGREYAFITKKQPLKLLFVGGLSQRKGIANLFAVVDRLKDWIELTVVGRKSGNECKVLDEALKKHQWIESLPHHEILKLMKQHDVLVFPSLFEGFGLVITEAMSQGTPVITTERTAGPDLIEDGVNGWITRAGSTEELQKAIEEILHRPEMIEKAGKGALETASLRPWDKYGHELVNAVTLALI